MQGKKKKNIYISAWLFPFSIFKFSLPKQVVKSKVKSVQRSLGNLLYKGCHAILVNSHHFTASNCFSKKFSVMQHHHFILAEFPSLSLSPTAEPALPFQNLFTSNASKVAGIVSSHLSGTQLCRDREDRILAIWKENSFLPKEKATRKPSH